MDHSSLVVIFHYTTIFDFANSLQLYRSQTLSRPLYPVITCFAESSQTITLVSLLAPLQIIHTSELQVAGGYIHGDYFFLRIW